VRQHCEQKGLLKFVNLCRQGQSIREPGHL
jgi:hypothetical protein